MRALVTGAGSGIGAAYARQLAGLGYDVVIVGRTRRKLDETADRIRRETDVDVEILPADLASREGVDAVIDRIRRDPALEIVVNSAGVATWGPVLENDVDELQREIDVNVQAIFRITVAATQVMRGRGRGAVVNVSSLSATSTMPYLATYCGTKGFLLNFGEALHEELRGSGVVVQTLLPGFTRTEIFATAGADTSKIPWFVWMEADSVVRWSLAALRRGRAICIPGVRYKIAYFLGLFVPRWINRRVLGLVLGRFDKLRLKRPESRTSDTKPPSTRETFSENDESPNSGEVRRTVHTPTQEAVL